LCGAVKKNSNNNDIFLFVFVTVFPMFTKTPSDVSLKSGSTAKLECAATGEPKPQIAWQKDGGNDFPAARERRMHVIPDDVKFYIVNVKPADMGMYSCTAENEAGKIMTNATLTVLGKLKVKSTSDTYWDGWIIRQGWKSLPRP
jgi:hypothetical protein